MNFQITSIAVGSLTLFQDFMKEIKSFTWNAWYRKYNSCKELFIWDHLTICCDRKILEKQRGNQENYLIHGICYCLTLIIFSVITFDHSALIHKIVLSGSSPLHHASFPHIYRDCFHFEPNCFFDSVTNCSSEHVA